MEYIFDHPLHGTIGTEHYAARIEWQNGTILSDESVERGGKGTGPDPHSLLLASLASCTLITLRMYIDRKGWDVPEIAVNVNMYKETVGEHTVHMIDRDIRFGEGLPEDQKTRLLEIASKCPISVILQSDIRIRSYVFRDQSTKTIQYTNDAITVHWKPEFCQHSTRCWKELPMVFKPKERKWIDPNAAAPDRIARQVLRCPSGALTYTLHRQGPDEKKESLPS